MTVLALSLMWLLAPAAAADPAAATDHPVKEDLKGVGENLEREQRLLRELEKESTSVLQLVSRMDDEIGAAQLHRREAEKLLSELDQQLADHGQKREEAAKALAAGRDRLRQRLRSLYKMGELGWMNLVFGGESAAEVLQRFRLVKRLARADRTLVEEVARSREELDLSDRRLQEERSRYQETARQVQQRKARAAEVRAEKLRALQLIQRQEAVHRKTMEELQTARQRLLQVVATIEGKGNAGKGFKSWQGRLPAPVETGVVEVLFGRRVDPRFKTVTINQGVDIRVDKGTPVKAIYPGQVAFAEPFEGYGLLVILDHGGGYFSLYAHLKKFAVSKGQRVTQGQELGMVGDTGSLKGPYLYFEIREGGKAVDPQAWVRLRAGAEH